MKRRFANSPISLFSFQDIITGLCGLLILFVLIMVIDLVMRRDGSPPPPPEPDRPVADLQAEIAELKTQLAELDRQIDEKRSKLSLSLSKEKAEEARKDLSEKDRVLSNLLAETKELETRLEKALDAQAKSAEKRRKMELALRNLEDSLNRLKQRNGVTLIPERGNGKSPVFVVLGRGKVVVSAPLDENEQTIEFSEDRLGEGLADALAGFGKDTHTVVLLVRPSGIGLMDRAFQKVESLGFPCGRDPLEENMEVSFGSGKEDGR